MTTGAPRPPGLAVLDPTSEHDFRPPAKMINEATDVPFFQTSQAYTDIMTFLLQLNAAMFPRRSATNPSHIQAWDLDSPEITRPPAIASLAALLADLEGLIAQAPPDRGAQRFGNTAFRTWHALAAESAGALLDARLPALRTDSAAARGELQAYLLGGFGSAPRLDYGTGHELSFLAFLAGVWKLGGFTATSDEAASASGAIERAIVAGVVDPYLRLVRRLIQTYTLEPAGSHGVWGLDDHAFVPYILGSAQLGPAVDDAAAGPVPTEGSRPGAPAPESITQAGEVSRQRGRNLYFGAVGFINDVKRGPFWEHSPVLYDVSGVRAGWAKINKGMLKMYQAEVLGKFPVVQHFPFGGLFRWERDPNAVQPAAATATTTTRPAGDAGTGTGTGMPPTRAPWASASSGAPSTAAIPPSAAHATTAMPPTRAPWASGAAATAAPGRQAPMAPTKAPWVKDR